MKNTTPIENLKTVIARLRHPTEGCPWDRDQTFASVAPYTIEEAYEVSDAIDCKDMSSLKEELGFPQPDNGSTCPCQLIKIVTIKLCLIRGSSSFSWIMRHSM